MFCDVHVRVVDDLQEILDKLMHDPEFTELWDNRVNVGIFLQENGLKKNAIINIALATEIEKYHGYDAIICVDCEWYTHASKKDLESGIYQMLLTLSPAIVGELNIAKLFMTSHEIKLDPRTVERYGTDISWYKKLYGDKDDITTDTVPKGRIDRVHRRR